MGTNATVESWFKAKNPPAEGVMRRVRDIILKADPRMTDYLKYGSLNFGYKGDFTVFVQTDKKTVSLMFHRGARIPGKFPNLEGEHPSARFMRIADEATAGKRASELTRIVKAWCDLMDSGGIKKKV